MLMALVIILDRTIVYRDTICNVNCGGDTMVLIKMDRIVFAYCHLELQLKTQIVSHQ